tara:strand:+ start:612 stop:1028 length:417 start_codon:yes stop_codon:yes gene_type:complete
MKAKFALFLITLFVASSPTQVLAHHSFAAEFDSNSPIEVEGIVIKVEWTNPHTYFFIEVETEDGDFEEWAMEMGSPNQLVRRGWSRNSLRIGDVVTVTGSRARDGKAKANAQSVVLDTGERLFSGTSQPDFVESDNSE